MNEYKALGDLQKLDIEIDELSEKFAHLPEQDELQSLEKELKRAEGMLEEKQISLSSNRSTQKKIEGELELLELKINHEDEKLYSGTIANPKELKSIQEEVNLLKEKKDKIETDLLEILDKIDNVNSEAKEISSRVEGLKREVERAEEDYRKAYEESEKRLQDLEAEKEKARSEISSSLVSVYEDIRKQKKEAAVAISEGVCQGCFVELPAEEVDKMLRNDKLWRCSQCRRILLR